VCICVCGGPDIHVRVCLCVCVCAQGLCVPVWSKFSGNISDLLSQFANCEENSEVFGMVPIIFCFGCLLLVRVLFYFNFLGFVFHFCELYLYLREMHAAGIC